MSRRWYIQPDSPTDAADGDIWEESDEYNTVIESEDTELCAKCGQPIKEVDLYGTEFFRHRLKQDCLTWWHLDKHRNTHQAVPGGER